MHRTNSKWLACAFLRREGKRLLSLQMDSEYLFAFEQNVTYAGKQTDK